MKKSILLLLLIFVAISFCNAKTAEKDNVLGDLLIQLDSLSLEEGQALYMKQYDSFVFMLNLLTKETDDITLFTEDEEKKNAVDSISTSVPARLYDYVNLKENIIALSIKLLK